MPFSTYLAGDMGLATLSPPGPLEAGSHAELILVYTAGTYGIDDSGMLKVSWRTTSDMTKPQFDRPQDVGFTTVEASNGAELECRFDRVNIRPWTNSLVIRVGRGYLKAGETITVRLGDRRQGSPGMRLQTNAEDAFELRVYADAFATYEFVEVPNSPAVKLVAGQAVRWKAIVPSLWEVGEPFRLAIVAEDRWGNPTALAEGHLTIEASMPVEGLPEHVDLQSAQMPTIVEGLVCRASGDLDLAILNEAGEVLCRANPLRLAVTLDTRLYWGDLHGQSGETVGTNPASAHFAFARDKAFIDIAGHQGNDFQITDAFWQHLNDLTAQFDEPGRFLAIPGYEWSGNTGLGGDRNVFYRHEGRPIHRSSHVLLTTEETSTQSQPTARHLFSALEGEDAVVIAHVGGRYADIGFAHDPRLETAVEVHSSWGTFEWLLQDALAKGYRVGIVCHSDDHKGRPGAAYPGASAFGAIGGLTAYLMPELTRDALFEALRRRHHYGTSGARIRLSVTGTFAGPVAVYPHDPILGGEPVEARAVTMGDIVAPGGQPMRLAIDVHGTAPIERVDIFRGAMLAESLKSVVSADSRRIALRWRGAEYRGRGRETFWRGEMAVNGNRYTDASAVNFLNPELRLEEVEPGLELVWRSVTTGNIAGLDLLLANPDAGSLSIRTNFCEAEIDLGSLGRDETILEAGGLGRSLTVRRLQETGAQRHILLERDIVRQGPGDDPVFVRVTQEDGHQAWSSPIYLIEA